MLDTKKLKGNKALTFNAILLCFLFFTPSLNLCSQPKVYTNLVFEGAGIRGIAYAGVLEVMEKNKLLPSIKKVGGTSAGAITALMVSLGYHSNEIESVIYKTNFKKFNDGKFFFIGGLHRVCKKYGWYEGQKFTHWLEKLIEAKTGNADCTFQELHTKGFKDLYVTGTCLNKQKVIVFSYETYPAMKVKDAIRISMSIPLFFKAVYIDSIGRRIEKPGKRHDIDLMIDGGMMANFPITIFDSTYNDATHHKIRIANPQTIGIRIDTDTQIENDKKNGALESHEVNSFRNYVKASYVLMLESLNRQPLTPEDWSRTISVSSADISPLLKKLSAKQKEMLIENGRKGAKEFLHSKQ